MMTLLQQIEAFLERTDTSPTAFGQTVLNDPGFVFNLRTGRDPKESTAIKVREFIAAFDASADAA
jgi:hypothetical protein